MSRSKTLTYYQMGYCGQPIDIEATKPRFAQAYCLGVGDVAAGREATRTGREIRERLRGVGGVSRVKIEVVKNEPAPTEFVELRQAPPDLPNFPLVLVSHGPWKIEVIKALRDVAYSLNISRDLKFAVDTVNALPKTFQCRSASEQALAASTLRAAGATVQT